MADEKNLLGLVGICKRAGKTIVGVPMICEHLQKLSQKRSKAGRVEDDVDIIVIEASDTSENTHKKISDKCIYYKAKHVRIESTCEILGRAVGKSAVAAVAIADKSFCRAILGKLPEDN
jgi:ribosomal protein L7Ae-like RNA K-turn-binding protein